MGFLAFSMACSSESDPDGDVDRDTLVDGDATSDGDLDDEQDGEIPDLTGEGSCESPFVYRMGEGNGIFDGAGDLDVVTDSVSPAVCGEDGAALSNGVEVVTKIALNAGDHLSMTFFGETIDASIYIRRNVCATSEGCEAVVNTGGKGTLETLTFTASEIGNYFVIMETDITDPAEADNYFFHIEVIRAGEDNLAGDGKIGAPCTGGYHCESGYCLTSSNLGALIEGEDVEVRNGYCTLLFCQTDGSDGLCGQETGGVCMSISPFYDYQFLGMGVCVRPCENDADCRVEDDMRCFSPQQFVELGLISQEIKDTYFGDVQACLPVDLAAEAVNGITE
jgi:hypothetical protein